MAVTLQAINHASSFYPAAADHTRDVRQSEGRGGGEAVIEVAVYSLYLCICTNVSDYWKKAGQALPDAEMQRCMNTWNSGVRSEMRHSRDHEKLVTGGDKAREGARMKSILG
jgi:hypothetical protein